MIRAALLALALAACSSPATPHRTGAPVPGVWPQVADQCAAQPALAWCRGR